MPEFHPASDLFPLMNGVELAALVEDIRLRGLLEPIVLHEGLVLDGRNRLRACELAGVQPYFSEWDVDGMSPVEWVVSRNLHRRHLTNTQRAALALDILPRLEAQARERKAEGGRSAAPGRPADKDSPESGDLSRDSRKSASEAAALVGVGRSAVEIAKAIQKRDDGVIDQMRSGEITSISQAARAVGLGEGFRRGPISDYPQEKIHYGKGDKWREASEPLRRYLVTWRKQDFAFSHLNPKEAAKRLATIDEIVDGLTAARADLEPRSHKARLKV